ncbi:unnamed protein product [Rhizoctonia solani]|uniref:Threonine/serine exporter-like N-terminal domain-containing protein n=1 Tax=Rhizoctonia solani TaxID=456999 RepID=A0A8H3D0N1_9AGAM|nr:unnamed protein product [Rhizoctonia solani]
MDNNAPIFPTSPRRQAPEAIGADPGDRYTRLLHRTRSRPGSRPRRSSLADWGSGDKRDTLVDPLDKNNMPGIAENRLQEELDHTSVPPASRTLAPTEQPVHVSILPFGPSRRRSSLATASTNISTPPPMYTGYGASRAPATEPIPQSAQFGIPFQTMGPEHEQSRGPFSIPADPGLRQHNPYFAYYTSPIVPPQPTMAPSLGFFDMYGYHPGRTSMIQPHHPPEEDEEEKRRLACYNARMDWDPDDEYDDPEPSVAARRPYSDETLPGYRPSGDDCPQSPKSDRGTLSQTMITVGSETGRKHFITENLCPLEQRRSFILTLSKALLQFQAPSHRIENQLEAAARVLDVPAEFLHLPSLVIVSFGNIGGEQGAPVVDKPHKFSFGSKRLKSAIATAVLGKNKDDSVDQTHQGNEDEVPELKTEHENAAHRTGFGIRVHIVKSGGKMELGKLHQLHTIYRSVVHDEMSAQDGRIKLLKLLKQPPIYNIYQRCVHAFICGLLICVMSFGGSFIDMWVAGAGCATIAYLQLGVASKNPLYSNIFEVSAAMLMSFIARGLSSINGHLFCYSAISSASVVLILPGSIISVLSGAFTFLKPAASVTNTVKYVSKGCTRRMDGPCIISSMWKLQPFLSKQLPIMVFISCCSYAANKAANRYIFNRSDVVSAIGAFVTGILGNAYARIFRGTAYTAMVTAVGFLVPSGIAAAGGLAQASSASLLFRQLKILTH